MDTRRGTWIGGTALVMVACVVFGMISAPSLFAIARRFAIVPAVLVGLFVVGASISGLMLTLLVSRDALDRTFSQLARKYGGECSASRLFAGFPKVRFYHRGVHVELETLARRFPWPSVATELRIPWDQEELELEVFSTSHWPTLTSGADRVRGFSLFFDSRFIVTGAPDETVREFITPKVEELIRQLRYDVGKPYLTLAVRDHELVLRKPGALADYSSLLDFTDAAMELFQQVRGLKPPPINKDEMEILPAPDKTASDAPVCRICGESIAEEPIFCNACRTPHHLDCWEYNDGCSIYGCGGKGYHAEQRTKV